MKEKIPTPEVKQEAVRFIQDELNGQNVKGYAIISVVVKPEGIDIQTLSAGWLPVPDTMQALAKGAMHIGESLGVGVHIREAIRRADGSLETLQ